MDRKKSYLLLIILGIAWMIWAGINKSGYHIDEVFTYMLSNNAFEGMKITGESGWVSPNYYLDKVSVTAGEPFNIKSVIFNQTKDVHPPLYYIIFHFVSWILSGVFSKWIGLSINIAFGLIVGILLYELSVLFTNNNVTSIIITVFYMFSLGATSNYLFLRMYLLLTIFQLLLTYLMIKILKYNQSKKHLVLYSFTIILGGLTHYYFYFYAFFLTLFAIIYLLLGRQLKRSIILAFCALSSVILAFISYPSVLDHVFNSGRGVEVQEELSKNFFNIESSRVFIGLASEQLFAGLLSIIIGFLLIAQVAYLLIKKDELNLENTRFNTKMYWVIFCTTISTLHMIAQVSPYKSSRYIYSIYPMVVFLVLTYLFKIVNISLMNKYANRVLAVFSVMITLLGLFQSKPDNLYLEMKENRTTLTELSVDHALIISDVLWNEAGQINELKDFSSIYRLPYYQQTELPVDDSLSTNDLIIFIEHSRLDNELFRDQLKEQYNIEELEYLYNYRYHNVYLAR